MDLLRLFSLFLARSTRLFNIFLLNKNSNLQIADYHCVIEAFASAFLAEEAVVAAAKGMPRKTF
jgi:hypothetical protein